MSKQYNKLKKTLQTIFEMDKADLDFGIYRIMNQKRDEITRFLDEDLLSQVNSAFDRYKSSGEDELQEELENKIKEATDLGAPDPQNAPAVLKIKEQIASAIDTVALENEVYSHLHKFFSRYYDQGDFISKRRYKADTYAIPYEGEEVKLHWANHDQYYIKSSEHLRDYAFTIPTKDKDGKEKSVRIKLVEADTEKDNVKAKAGEERKFVLDKETPISIVENELLIHFHYIPAGKKKQTKLNEEAVATIEAQEGFDDWLTLLNQLSPTEKNKDRTLLGKHLNDYTARNTFDYFIHKDLGGFLRRELDFYIKNEVLFLDDLGTIEDDKAQEERAFAITEQQIRKIKVVRTIAEKIIQMLAQLEDFQKKLWLKKKFVVDTNYCITLDRVPVELYGQIASCSEQHAEWVSLGFTTEKTEITEDYLKKNPYLVLDTKFFGDDFKTELLASIEDFDAQCGGLLIHSENYQALNLLHKQYQEQVSCVHIDPPYNTATSGFLYKNEYQHSSWLSLMENRIAASLPLLNKSASYLCHIDENEYENLFSLFNSSGLLNAGTIVWDKRNPMNGGSGVANQHEYVIARTKQKGPIYLRNKSILSMLDQAKKLIEKYGSVSELTKKEFSLWVNANDNLSGGEKAYRYLDDKGRIYQSVSLRAPEPRKDPKFHRPLIHPVSEKPCAVPPNGFSRTPETLQGMKERGEILFGNDETTQPRQRVFLTEGTKRQMPSMIQDAKKGKTWTDALGVSFPYCHPVSLYEELVGAATKNTPSITLDYFAGSGTTGHSIFNLNREDGGNRKYILVEMGKHFDAVLKPRISKVIYSDKWKNGKPQDKDGTSHCFKYLRLESYEDTLNNLILNDPSKQQQGLLDDSAALREEYNLGYWIDLETAGSPSLLNIEQFEDPFNYTLNIGSGSVDATKPTKVDLVETFNYLLGLTVKRIDTLDGFKVIEGTNPQDEDVLVVWRILAEKDNASFEKFIKRKLRVNPREHGDTVDYQYIYINGDHTLEDPHSKVKMIEIEFKRLMFEAE